MGEERRGEEGELYVMRVQVPVYSPPSPPPSPYPLLSFLSRLPALSTGAVPLFVPLFSILRSSFHSSLLPSPLASFS